MTNLPELLPDFSIRMQWGQYDPDFGGYVDGIIVVGPDDPRWLDAALALPIDDVARLRDSGLFARVKAAHENGPGLPP